MGDFQPRDSYKKNSYKKETLYDVEEVQSFLNSFGTIKSYFIEDSIYYRVWLISKPRRFFNSHLNFNPRRFFDPCRFSDPRQFFYPRHFFCPTPKFYGTTPPTLFFWPTVKFYEPMPLTTLTKPRYPCHPRTDPTHATHAI